MAVIGNRPAQSFNSIRKQTFTGTGDSAYSLDFPVSSPNDLEVFVNNVRQEPTVAYNAASQTLTMSEGIDSTDDFYAIYKAQAYGTTTLPVNQPITVAGATINGNASIAGTASFAGGTISGNVSLDSGYTLSAPTAGQIYAPGHQLQTVYTSSDTTTTLNSTSFTEPSTDYRVTITPKFANSLIVIDYIIPANPGASYAANTIYNCRCFRLISGGSKDYTSFENAGKVNGSRNRFAGMAIRPVGYDTNDPMWWTMKALDKPNTTSSVTYGFEFKRETGGDGTVYFGYSAGDTSNWGYSTDVLITATEIKQ